MTDMDVHEACIAFISCHKQTKWQHMWNSASQFLTYKTLRVPVSLQPDGFLSQIYLSGQRPTWIRLHPLCASQCTTS